MTTALNTGRFVKRPLEVQATQWFRNGDHPEDDPTRMAPEVDFCEGAVVRYFRHPDFHSMDLHDVCGRNWHAHGWIDTQEGGHTVCPGDWVITDIAFEEGSRAHGRWYYPVKPRVFNATYDRLGAEPDPYQLTLF